MILFKTSIHIKNKGDMYWCKKCEYRFTQDDGFWKVRIIDINSTIPPPLVFEVEIYATSKIMLSWRMPLSRFKGCML